MFLLQITLNICNQEPKKVGFIPGSATDSLYMTLAKLFYFYKWE